MIRLALLDADRGQHVHYREITRKNGLLVDHLCQNRVETLVHARNSVPRLPRYIEEALHRWVGRLRQRIHPDLLQQRYGCALIGVRVALGDRPHQPEPSERRRPYRNVMGRDISLEARWQDQVPATLAFVVASGANDVEGHVPHVAQLPVQPGADRWWYLQDERTVLPGAVCAIDVPSGRIRRRGLESPVGIRGEVRDVVVPGAKSEKSLPDGIGSDDRHSPDCRFDRTTVFEALVEAL